MRRHVSDHHYIEHPCCQKLNCSRIIKSVASIPYFWVTHMKQSQNRKLPYISLSKMHKYRKSFRLCPVISISLEYSLWSKVKKTYTADIQVPSSHCDIRYSTCQLSCHMVRRRHSGIGTDTCSRTTPRDNGGEGHVAHLKKKKYNNSRKI